MKRVCLLLIALFVATFSYSKEVKGRVFHAKKGIPNVVVSDGYKFAVTDKDGYYTLMTSKDAEFVFIVTPSGYMPLCDRSTPQFYKKINGADFDFQLYKFGIPGGTYRMLAVGDPQPRGDWELSRLKNEAFAELKDMGDRCREMGLPVFSVFLGDILYDNLDLYPYVKEMMADIQMPVWPVIGNHDHNDKAPNDEDGDNLYTDAFGPNYYAFNAGKDYYIVLDNILYDGIENYEEGLNPQQINWIKGYLKYVPKDSHIFVAMHSPVYFYRWKDYKMVMADEFIDAFKDYDVTVISGHTHIQYNYEINSRMREYNIASVGGAWWIWDVMYSRDGTPCGYQVFDSNRKGITNFWKSTGKPDDWQFKIYPIGTVENHIDELCIKVWNWDSRWKVEWYEDGKYKGNMVQFSAADPDYSAALQTGYFLNGKTGGVSPIPDGYFYFSASPAAGASTVKVVVTDAYGKKYEEEVNLR